MTICLFVIFIILTFQWRFTLSGGFLRWHVSPKLESELLILNSDVTKQYISRLAEGQRHTQVTIYQCLIGSNSGSSSGSTFWWKSTKVFDRQQLSKSRCKHLSSFPGLDSQNIFVQIFQIYLLKLLDTFCQITIVFMRRRLSKSPSKHLSSFPESDSHVIDVLGWDLILT